MIESLLREWDGETVVVRYDQPTGAWILIAVHSTRLGPAAGGTRMKPYPDLPAALLDALRLSEGMTYKFAGPGIPFGGGKAVIAVPHDLAPEDRPDLLRRYGALVRQLGGLYYTAPDVGTGPADMDIIAETGAPYVFGRTVEAGGPGTTGPPTALGVFAGIQVACEHLFGDSSLQGRHVLVQGTGTVGGALIDYLRQAGAQVAFSEVDEGAIRRFRDREGLEYVVPEAVHGYGCDIYAPCALGAVLNAETIPQLACRAVVGAANNQLAQAADAERLQARGILYAPDFVVNAGGALFGIGVEVQGWNRERAMQEAANTVRRLLREVLQLAAAEGITTAAAAQQIAREPLSKEQ